MKKIINVLFLFLIFVSITNAETNSVINRLKNEPVSMLDWGMIKLEESLEDYWKNIIKINVPGIWMSSGYTSVSYDEKRNIIVVEVIVFYEKEVIDKLVQKRKVDVDKSLCGDIISWYKKGCGVNPETGHSYHAITSFFMRKKIVNKYDKEFEAFSNELERNIKIYVTITPQRKVKNEQYGEITYPLESYACESNLHENKISFKGYSNPSKKP